jgi:AcrR family transcriptional regulator
MKNTRGKREAILEAAFKVVTAKGYFETKVDDICHKAGCAKGTVYLYFKDKPDIYLGLIDSLFSRALEIVVEIDARPLPPEKKLEAVFSEWAKNVFTKPGVLALISPEHTNLPSEAIGRFRQTILPRIEQMIEAVAHVIRPGIESGRFRSVDAKLAALMFLQTFQTGVIAHHQGIGLKDPHNTVLKLFLSGLLAPARGKGRRPTIGNRR